MLKFYGINKAARSDAWQFGLPVFIDPAHVIALEPKSHSYHSFRPSQEYTVVHLSTGAAIEVFSDVVHVEGQIAKAKAAPR